MDFATANSSAVAPADYTAQTGTLTFAPGVTAQQITVAVVGDSTVESDEFFVVNLSNASNATIDNSQGFGRVLDNDGAPALPRIVISDTTLLEADSGTTNMVFTVTLSASSASTVTVQFQTANSSAVAPSDYTAVALTTLTFAPGVTTQQITVAVVGDEVVEGNEVFAVNLSNAANATIADTQGLGTIFDNDASRQIIIADATLLEGDSGTQNLVFTVSLSRAAINPVTVQFQTANSSAVAPSDYTAVALTTLTFAPGVTTQQITVAVVGDEVVEGNEVFAVNLSNAANATIADTQGLGTIFDNDASRQIIIADATLLEGDSGTQNLVFTVSLSRAAINPVTVQFQTANSSAVAPSDYTAVALTTLTFAPGVTTQQITVAVVGDEVVEGNEVFAVNLSNAANATIADTQGLGTIFDNDASRQIIIADATLLEGDSGTQNLVFTVSLSRAAINPVTVQFQTANSSAVAPSDYTAVALTTLTFAPGVTTQQITVAVVGDEVVEGNEVFAVNLSNAANATIADTQGLGTIFDNDASRQIIIADATLLEGDSGTQNLVFTVSLSRAAINPVTVQFQTANSSAVAPSDYTAVALTTLTFAPGVTTQQITVAVVGDEVVEGNEVFAVNLSNAANATIADTQGLGTIFNDDAAPTLSIGDVAVLEGNAGTASAVFTVTRTGPATAQVTVNFTTANSTAAAGTDYTTTSGTLTFAPGTVTQQITVPILGDAVDELNEAFLVNLSGAANATIVDGQGVGTILDNEGLTLAIDNVTVTEGDTGTGSAVFTVTLSAPSIQTVTVNFATADSTAVAPGDYTAQTGTLTFAPGSTTQQITVSVVGETAVEAAETFLVNLSGATNATTADAQGVGTITGDDVLTLSIDQMIEVGEGDTGTTNAVLTVTLSQPAAAPVTVDFATANFNAVAPGDYTAQNGTLTFAPGTTTQTITVAVVGDSIVEGDEFLVVNLSNALNATIDNSQAFARILDNDTRTLSIDQMMEVGEGDTGTTNAVLTVTLSQPAAAPVTVDFATANFNAVAPGDYTAQTGALTFAPGTTTQTITVAVVGDSIVEGDEFFLVNLSNALNATIDNSQAFARILDNDTRTLSIDQMMEVGEGDTGTTNAVLTVTLSQPAAAPVTVDFATANFNAVAPGDYTAQSDTLTFAPGTTTQTITVAVVGDSIVEGDEFFLVNLSNALNATIDNSQAFARILDNDTRTLSIDQMMEVGEGDTGTTNAVLTVTLSQPAAAPVTVDFATANSNAVAPGDYTAQNGTLTFAPGTTTQTITVAVVGDSTVEADEFFVVNLSNALNATIDNSQAFARILDNDTRTLSIDQMIEVGEGDTGTTNAVLTVTLSQPAAAPVTVDFATANSNAVAPGDYTAQNGTLTFAPGTTTQTITVAVVGDSTVEADEFLVVNLSNALNATIDNSQAFVRILDNDGAPALPRIVINDVSRQEGDSGSQNLVFTLTLSAPSALPVTVQFQTANSSAVAPSDYQALALSTLTFAPGATTQLITVAVVGDEAVEGDEIFTVNLTSAVNATIGDTQGVGTIYDNDASRRIVIADVSRQEGDSGTQNLVFTVTLSRPALNPVTVQFQTANSSAVAPGDYQALALSTLTFAPGATTQLITVAVVGDEAVEGDESFTVNLTNAVNATIGDTQGVGTIYDNDASRRIDIADASLQEGDSGTRNLVFTVTLSRPALNPVTVQFQTANSSADAPGDFQAVALSTLTFAPGATTQLITVAVAGDEAVEGDEIFTVNLTSAVNATIGDTQGVGTIYDNDASRRIVIADASLQEGDSGTRNLVFTVTLSRPALNPVTVQFQTANSSADAPGDFQALALSTLTFAPGATTQLITVAVVGDEAVEGDESFTVNLTNAVNATIGDTQGVGTIYDNDASRHLVIADVSRQEGDSGTQNLVFTVTLSRPALNPVTVQFQTANSSAVAPGDYQALALSTLTFAPGVTTQTITVAIVGDTTIESNEVLVVNLTNAVNATIADSQGVGTIFDND